MAIVYMSGVFARNWWVFLVRGLVAVLFGVMAFLLPGLTLLTLVFLCGFYLIMEGAIALLIGGRAHAWSLIIVGALGLAAGVLAFAYPIVTAFGLLVLLAAWALTHGVFEIVAAIRLRREIRGEWLFIVGGALSVLFGVLLLANPAAGVVAMVWFFGLYALLFGVTMCIFAFEFRRLSGHDLPSAS